MKKLLAVLLALAAPAGAAPLNDQAIHAAVSRAFHPLLMQLSGNYQEDTAHVNGHFGTMVLGVRRDTPTSLAGADNDYMPFTMNASGAIWVAGNGTFTVGDGSGALNVIVDSGSITANAGTNLNTSALALESGGNLATVAALAKAEDAAHTSTETGILALAVRNDAGTALAADGDRIPFSIDSAGALRVTGGGGGTQYTEGDTDASITGTAALMEGAANTLLPVQGTVADGLLVNLGGNNDVVASATNLDIRDLVAASDAVTVHGDVGVVDQFDLTNSNPLATQIVDGNGDAITSFGGGTQYTEDAAAAANPVGTALNLVREDARAGSLTNTDGDNVAARGTNAGELYVKHVDTIPVTQSGTWDEVGINDSGNSITVDGTVTVTDGSGALNVIVDSSALPSGAATAANQTTTIGHVDGIEGLLTTIDADTGTIAGAVSGTEMQVDVVAALPAGNNNIGDVDVASSALPTGASTSANQTTEIASLSVLDDWDNGASDGASVSGDTAHDAADAGEPVKIGHKAVAHVAPTEVAAGDRVDSIANRDGVAFVIGGNPGAVTETATWLDADGAQTGTAIHTVSAGTKICVTRILVACDLDNTVAVDVRVVFDTDGTLGARSTTGLVGSLFDLPDIGPGGGGNSGDGGGLLGCGADDEDLRYSGEDPVGGGCSVTATYYETAT